MADWLWGSHMQHRAKYHQHQSNVCADMDLVNFSKWWQSVDHISRTTVNKATAEIRIFPSTVGESLLCVTYGLLLCET